MFIISIYIIYNKCKLFAQLIFKTKRELDLKNQKLSLDICFK